MSVHAALDRLDGDRAAQVVATRRPGATGKDVWNMDETLDDLAGIVSRRDGFDGCRYARAA